MDSIDQHGLRVQFIFPYPRVRNLREYEQVPFEKWLGGHTRPWVNGVPEKDQDFFYHSDYNDWKSRGPRGPRRLKMG